MSIVEERRKYAENRKARQEGKLSKARELFKAGYSRREISEILGVSEAVLRLWI